ncbi:hypothetical protein [Hyphomicrobium sp.]|uniref:hypothetical protein n=1 Tax=Hyphomicrobium sp. TaxID=82 RepID=UPI0025BE1A92|nr:hypothetical protein [Hyphomicrobium sp.]MCC7253491.1 hypothetical protein [Hyphomicrobium sp.]
MSTRRGTSFAVAGALLILAAAGPVAALEEPPDEMAALKACEKRLCTMVLGKKPTGDDLACDVQKTWAKSTLKEGESKGMSWGFGDARCKVDLKLGRADVVAALTRPKHTVRVPPHQVNCVVEREGELKPLTARLAPKLKFKDGKADKVWINLESIEGPSDVKSTIWAAAQLEDTLGIFHRPMIKSINKFLHRQCARRYGPEAEAAKKDDAKKTKVASDKSAKPAAKEAPPKAKASTTGP